MVISLFFFFKLSHGRYEREITVQKNLWLYSLSENHTLIEIKALKHDRLFSGSNCDCERNSCVKKWDYSVNELLITWPRVIIHGHFNKLLLWSQGKSVYMSIHGCLSKKTKLSKRRGRILNSVNKRNLLGIILCCVNEGNMW